MKSANLTGGKPIAAYNELQEMTVENQTCRIVRMNKKTIALFSTEMGTTEFEIGYEALRSVRFGVRSQKLSNVGQS
jgi:hypothetical protein